MGPYNEPNEAPYFGSGELKIENSKLSKTGYLTISMKFFSSKERCKNI